VTRTTADEVLLAVARLAMDASLRAATELGGISPVQLRALTALRQRGTVNLAQLSQEMGVSVSTASRLVGRLVAVDWVHRRPSEHDRREISLSLTTSGRQLLRRYDDRRAGLLRNRLDNVPEDRRAAVVDALAQFVDPARA
jgi:DNA-binding MarR family transcriptional regulator